MVRSYLRHEPTHAFGLICSPSGRAVLAADGKIATVAALEDVLVWDVKTGQQVSMWHETGHRSAVTALAHGPAGTESEELWAVGYADGSIRIWDAPSATVRLTLNGHRSAITALRFDNEGLVLASGSQDTNITLWDLVAETGMYRLKGHRDAITDLAFWRVALDNDRRGTSAAINESRSPTHTADEKHFLFTTSKDGLLKVWDLALQHCVETVLPGKGELWSLAILSSEQLGGTGSEAGTALILVGTSDGKAKLYEATTPAVLSVVSSKDVPGDDNTIKGVSTSSKLLVECGQVDLVGAKRITQISYHRSAAHCRFVAISGSDRSVEVYRLRTIDDIKKKMARRRRRAKEKAEKKATASSKNGNDATKQDGESDSAEPTWSDRLEAYTTVRPSKGRIKSFAFAETSNASSGSTAPLLLSLGNNSLEVFQVPVPPSNKSNGVSNEEESRSKEAVLACALDLAGHRSEVRALGLSSDDSMLASADSAGSLKVWNTTTGKMVRSLPCGYALALAWLQDDQHVIVGCKDGTLKTYDVRSGVQLEDIPAHEGPIWSVAIHPDGRSCLTASGDKDVKFWEFEARSDEEVDKDDENGDDGTSAPPRGATTLGLVHVRTLKMTDDVLCARFSPDGRLLALALLDSTVKVFYADSLKFFLSLYGHKLPVLSLDISGDSKLCVTVSADKNAKIWGLDYGDCHRSLFAHEESVMAVAFEKGDQGGGLMGGREGRSHRFWTCAKDGKLKYWDGDRFQCVQTMVGHHGDVTALAVGQKGTVVVSAGLDRSLRVWEKTDEPLFLEEERERELEEMYEGGGEGHRERDDDDRQYGSLAADAENQAQDGRVQENGAKEVESVTRSTKDTLMAGERLLEAIELAAADLESFAEYERQKQTTGLDLAPPARNPLLAHSFGPDEEVDAHAYVLKCMTKILPSHLDDALLVLPFEAMMRLMTHLNHWASKEWNISLVSRVLFFLLRNYHAQIVANRIMRTTLQSLRGHLRAALQRQKMTIGYNLAGLQYVKGRLVEKRTGEMYMRDGFDLDEETVRQRMEQGQIRKRKMVA